jgi:hypothetical protein
MQMSRVAFWFITAGTCGSIVLTSHAVGSFCLYAGNDVEHTNGDHNGGCNMGRGKCGIRPQAQNI